MVFQCFRSITSQPGLVFRRRRVVFILLVMPPTSLARAALVMWCGLCGLLEIRHAVALTTGAKHWHRQKAVFYVFVSVPPVFIHRTEGRSWYQPILHNHNRPSPRLNPTPYPYHQATLNHSAIFACMVFRIMRHLRCRWLQISFLVGFYIYFAQIGAFSRKIIIFAKARLSISLKY